MLFCGLLSVLQQLSGKSSEIGYDERLRGAGYFVQRRALL
jgi:hypothetical protein